VGEFQRSSDGVAAGGDFPPQLSVAFTDSGLSGSRNSPSFSDLSLEARAGIEPAQRAVTYER